MLIVYDEGACDRSMGLIKGLEKGAGRVDWSLVTDSYFPVYLASFSSPDHIFYITRK